MSIPDCDVLAAEAAEKALLGLPEAEVLAAEPGDGLLLTQSGAVFMGWSESNHPATPEDGEDGDVVSISYSPSYSPAYRPPTLPVSPPPSPELARVLDMAVSLASLHDADDNITASFEPMESDDAAGVRMSRVEPVDWASDKEGSVFDHEVEPIQDAVAQTLRPIIFKSVLALSSVGSTQD